MSGEPLPRPSAVRRSSCNYCHSSAAIKLMTIKVSKRLEILVVARPSVGHMPAAGEHEQEEAWVLCVVGTKAAKRLVIGVGGGAGFGQRVTKQSL